MDIGPTHKMISFFWVILAVFLGQDGANLSKLRKPNKKKEKNERKMHNSFAK